MENGCAAKGGGESLSMVYEDELRQACAERKLSLAEQRAWMEFRRRLPISRWVERPGREIGRQDLLKIRQEIKRCLEVFEAEARERSLSLDMERNYYKAAVRLLNECRQLKKFSAEDREILRNLMILVDWKDAILGHQIVQSVV
jgi:hypothetical protein